MIDSLTLEEAVGHTYIDFLSYGETTALRIKGECKVESLKQVYQWFLNTKCELWNRIFNDQKGTCSRKKSKSLGRTKDFGGCPSLARKVRPPFVTQKRKRKDGQMGEERESPLGMKAYHIAGISIQE